MCDHFPTRLTLIAQTISWTRFWLHTNDKHDWIQFYWWKQTKTGWKINKAQCQSATKLFGQCRSGGTKRENKSSTHNSATNPVHLHHRNPQTAFRDSFYARRSEKAGNNIKPHHSHPPSISCQSLSHITLGHYILRLADRLHKSLPLQLIDTL